MTKKYTAQCACGLCKFEFDTDPSFIANCSCNDCKRRRVVRMATFFGVPEDDFTLMSGKPKAFHYVAESGKGLDRNFCLECGARLFTNNLESFPGLVRRLSPNSAPATSSRIPRFALAIPSFDHRLRSRASGCGRS